MPLLKKKLHLKVVFDTNVIFQSSSSELLRNEIAELIEKYSTSSDIEISWHLPEVVVKERKFQMVKKGNELLPAILKLEKLLGHNLAISKEIIENRIEDAIKKQITKFKINCHSLQMDQVKWEDIIHSACFRVAPFEDSDKEKGFRDAMILESVLQIIEASPVSASICRIALITNDNLLKEAFLAKMVNRKNVTVLADANELENLINVLDSQIKEELVTEISKKAQELFFIKDDKTTFYFKEDVFSHIRNKYDVKLKEVPPLCTTRRNGTLFISPPVFVKKNKQKISWKTPVYLECNGYRLEPTTGEFTPSISIFGIETTGNSPSAATTNKEILLVTGKSKLEIFWSTTLTTTKNLINPKIDNIEFLETTWNSVS